ncbi:MAG: butyrate kinase [Bacillota bacterium]
MQRQQHGDAQILVINPGAVSTKLALFAGTELMWTESIYHPEERLRQFARVAEEEDYRYEALRETSDDRNLRWDRLSAVVGRGGLMKPVAGGTYRVSEAMLKDLRNAYQGEHASNLGGLLAHRVAESLGIPAFVVDPVPVDEMHSLARYSGLRDIERRSLAHTLNIKAVCREVLGSDYATLRVVAVHLGSGVSVTAHDRGRMIDVNNAVEEGPFGTERTGALPVLQLTGWVAARLEEGHTVRVVQRMLTGSGGLYSYLGTKDLLEIEERIDTGDERAGEVLEALAYQVSKEIGAMSAVLAGDVDRILITGGMANSQRLVTMIESRVSRFAPVTVMPGEREMEALALGALRVLRGEEEPAEYR